MWKLWPPKLPSPFPSFVPACRRRRPARLAFALTLALSALLSGRGGEMQAHAAEGGGGTSVRIDRGRITADVGQVPVADVLAQIARDTGTPVLVRGDLGLTRPQSFADVPLLDGLERLVAPNHVVVEFAPAKRDYSPKIAKIRIFGLGAATDPSVEPVSLTPGGRSAASQPVPPRPAAAFDGSLGWTYEDLESLPPLAFRIRRIGSIYAVSGEQGLTALAEVLQADPEPSARSAAVRAIGGFPYPQALPLLQEAIGDESSEVRLAAISALRPDADNPPTFLSALITDESEDPRVRLAAIERLGSFRYDSQVQEALQEAVGSEDGRISAAARALIQP